MVGWLLRFIHNIRIPSRSGGAELTFAEICQAKLALLYNSVGSALFAGITSIKQWSLGTQNILNIQAESIYWRWWFVKGSRASSVLEVDRNREFSYYYPKGSCRHSSGVSYTCHSETCWCEQHAGGVTRSVLNCRCQVYL